MKISLNWLNTYFDRPATADEAERVLTDIGFPFDSVEPHRDDFILDVEITSNRPDLLSHTGVAREFAAATDRKFTEPAIHLHEPLTGIDVHSLAGVTNHASDLCTLYTARVITGVKVGPSPAWLAERLEAIGLRPINNVVDVTNFVLHELGQPLHTFDLARLAGRQVIVRRAAAGEPVTAIDGSVHKLTPDMLVIADGQQPQAIAGIMGGKDSEVTEATTDILLESASFAPLSVRATSRALKLASDSSYRFERKVDPAGLDRASRRAAQLILALAGGSVARGVIAVGQELPEPRKIVMDPERCRAILGLDVAAHEMVSVLDRLGLQPAFDKHSITCTVPSHRLDLRREIDLIEEVARLRGYAAIPVQQKMAVVVRPPQRTVEARRTVNRVLVAHGYFETVTFSFLPPKFAEPFNNGAALVKVDEEKKKAEPAIRPSVLPSLLATRKANQDAGNRDVKLFEVAHVFSMRDDRYAESRKLALLTDAEKPADAMRIVRGTIEELLHAMGLRATIGAASTTPQWALTAAEIVAGDESKQVLGYYGPASDAVLKLFDLQTPVILTELDYAALIAAFPREPRADVLPRFPAIERDLSIVVDELTPWAQVEKAVLELRPALMEGIGFVTTYRGKPIASGKKSVTLRMTFRDPARTLQHDEVSTQVQAVVQKLQQTLGAELRAS